MQNQLQFCIQVISFSHYVEMKTNHLVLSVGWQEGRFIDEASGNTLREFG